MDTGTSSWDVVKNFRPIPAELRNLPEVNAARIALVTVAGAFAIWLPFLVGDNDMPKLVPLPIYGMVGVSLVVLTGWAGQISLGQFGLVGIGGRGPEGSRSTTRPTSSSPSSRGSSRGSSPPCSSVFPRCGSRGCTWR